MLQDKNTAKKDKYIIICSLRDGCLGLTQMDGWSHTIGV